MRFRNLFTLCALLVTLTALVLAQQPSHKQGPARDPKTGRFVKTTPAPKGPARDPKTGRFVKRTVTASHSGKGLGLGRYRMGRATKSMMFPNAGQARDPRTGRFVKPGPARDPRTGRFIKKPSPPPGHKPGGMSKPK